MTSLHITTILPISTLEGLRLSEEQAAMAAVKVVLSAMCLREPPYVWQEGGVPNRRPHSISR